MNYQNEPLPTWLFIANPVAGGGKVRKQWSKLEPALRSAGVHFEVVFTKEKSHATTLAMEAIAAGYRHLVAVGGDGTAHEVVNGIFQQTTCPPEEVTFTLLPIGTGNDWIKEHRIPKNFRRWLDFFQKSKTSFQDAGWLTFHKNGRVEKRWFLNVAGLSYDGYLAKEAESQPGRVSSKFFYLLLIFRCLFRFIIPKIRVTFDGQKVEDFLYTINAGICRYSGGGFRLVPQAITGDGLLALTLARRISKLEVLLITPLFYTGKVGLHPAVSLHQAKEISVEALDGQPVLVEADGEFLGEAPVKMGVVKKGLKILVP